MGRGIKGLDEWLTTSPEQEEMPNSIYLNDEVEDIAWINDCGNLTEDLYEKPIKVRCVNCGWVNEQETQLIDISEDMQGADVLIFKCCQCETKGKSRRYG